MLQYFVYIFFYLLRPFGVVCIGEIVFGAMTGLPETDEIMLLLLYFYQSSILSVQRGKYKYIINYRDSRF